MVHTDIRTALRLKIKEVLRNCNSNIYPNFCRQIQTRDGYLRAEEMVIHYVIQNTLPVSTAIAQLESELG